MRMICISLAATVVRLLMAGRFDGKEDGHGRKLVSESEESPYCFVEGDNV